MTYRVTDADANTRVSDTDTRTFTFTVQARGDFAPRFTRTTCRPDVHGGHRHPPPDPARGDRRQRGAALPPDPHRCRAWRSTPHRLDAPPHGHPDARGHLTA